jgi:hypothetical protein
MKNFALIIVLLVSIQNIAYGTPKHLCLSLNNTTWSTNFLFLPFMHIKEVRQVFLPNNTIHFYTFKTDANIQGICKDEDKIGITSFILVKNEFDFHFKINSARFPAELISRELDLETHSLIVLSRK